MNSPEDSGFLPAGGNYQNLLSYKKSEIIYDFTLIQHDSSVHPELGLSEELLAAGCVTFQNRLSPMLQAHPDPSGLQELTRCWMDRWVARIGGFQDRVGCARHRCGKKL